VVSISKTSDLIADTAVKVSVSVLRRFGSAQGCSARPVCNQGYGLTRSSGTADRN